MKISAVTVCFNSAATIGHTVESFLAQSHPDKELLVIDGGSADRTVEIVKGFSTSDIRIISESDRGIYDAMNKGLRDFSGDAVGFLNSDDTYHDAGTLARIADGLERTDAVYGDLVMVDSHDTKRVVRNWQAGPFQPGAFRKGWMPPHPTFYIRRELANAVGAFDLHYRISADYDFMLRALELQAPRVGYIPHPMIDFLTGGHGSGLRAVIKGNLECLRSRHRNLGTPLLDPALVTKPARKILQLRWR
ncbi:MAG TPA: glycosyltransferase family 2 protein [Rhizomicrobium sp.]